MFVWRRRAGVHWLAANEGTLQEFARQKLAIIQAPDCKTTIVELAGARRGELETIRKRFGGRIISLPRDWLKRAQKREAKPIKIGKNLTICQSGPRTSRRLVIPAGAAFGTGDHATTAMSLRLLEWTTRNLGHDWSLLDLGTGSGIVALVAMKFGARRVVAIDSDPVAISVANANARLNRIDGIDFQIADARRFAMSARFDVVAANLYSGLLLEILPKLKRNRWLILSGILRNQQTTFLRALNQHRIEVIHLRRRGKWIAALCRGLQSSGFAPRSVLPKKI